MTSHSSTVRCLPVAEDTWRASTTFRFWDIAFVHFVDNVLKRPPGLFLHGLGFRAVPKQHLTLIPRSIMETISVQPISQLCSWSLSSILAMAAFHSIPQLSFVMTPFIFSFHALCNRFGDPFCYQWASVMQWIATDMAILFIDIGTRRGNRRGSFLLNFFLQFTLWCLLRIGS